MTAYRRIRLSTASRRSTRSWPRAGDPYRTGAVAYRPDLERAYGLEKSHSYSEPGGETHVFKMAATGPQGELHLAVRPSLPPPRAGAGGVHHVALRIRDEDISAWAEHLCSLGLATSGEVERYYFRSIYYREPNGVLLELATDGPGFSADEPLKTLGQSLSLPPFLEGRRADIEANLKPLEV